MGANSRPKIATRVVHQPKVQYDKVENNLTL